jgi:hypothetical protein
MRAGAFLTALALQVSISPAAAQPVTEAEAHVLSALTSRADPRMLADGVRLGPTLAGQLGADTDRRKAYEALIERTTGQRLRVNVVPPADAAGYANLVGDAAGPLILVEAGELALLLQYALPTKNVTFVEQLRGPSPQAAAAPPAPEVEAPELPAEAPHVEPVVALPLPDAPPAPEVPAAAAVERPKPAAKPKPAPAPAPVVASPRPAPKPRGECVVKPVMSEDDLYNCSAPARPVRLDTLPPPVTPPAAVPKAPEPTAPAPRRECVIKPVMTDDDLQACR